MSCVQRFRQPTAYILSGLKTIAISAVKSINTFSALCRLHTSTSTRCWKEYIARADKIAGDVSYLNEIKKNWLKCEEVPRTLISSQEMVELYVSNTETKGKMALRLPDFSGETFQALFTDRNCDENLAPLLRDSIGILFFINAERTNDMILVTDHVFPDEYRVDKK